MSERRRVQVEAGSATPKSSFDVRADEIARLQAEQDRAKAWGEDTPSWLITVGKDGKRTDYEGYKEWRDTRADAIDTPEVVEKELDLRDDPDTLRTLGLMEFVVAGKKLSERNDQAGLDELYEALENKLVYQALEEQWGEDVSGKDSETMVQAELERIKQLISLDRTLDSTVQQATEQQPTPGEEPEAHEGDEQATEQQSEEFDEARTKYLEIVARGEKGHLRRFDPTGRVVATLDSIGNAGFMPARKLADWLTQPSAEEREASEEYLEAGAARDERFEEALQTRIHRGELSEEEAAAERANRIVDEYIGNITRIEEIQQKTSKKPMSKLLRRAGYVAAGIAGGAVALTPVGLVGGLLVAGGAAAGIRVLANKRNAKTVRKDAEGEERLASTIVRDGREAEFKELQESVDADNALRSGTKEQLTRASVVSAHEADTAREVQKNRDRITAPIIGAATVAAAFAAGMRDFQGIDFGQPSSEAKHFSGSISEKTVPEYPDSIKGTEFFVDAGHGYTHEISEFADINGMPISDERAYEIHEQLRSEFGDDYITMLDNQGNDIYSPEHNNIGLDRTGDARWNSGVAERMIELINQAQ